MPKTRPIMFWSMHNQSYVGCIALCTRKKLLKSGEIRGFYGHTWYTSGDSEQDNNNLKCASDSHDNYLDIHLSFILDELAPRSSTVESQIRNVFELLEWKIKIWRKVISSYDQYMLEKNKFDLFCSLSKSLYSKVYRISKGNLT